MNQMLIIISPNFKAQTQENRAADVNSQATHLHHVVKYWIEVVKVLGYVWD